MPRLAAPGGYICVIRDIDSSAFLIDGTDHPATYVQAIANETERNFGIELVSILETEDLRASESELYERHHARLSEEWHTLDEYQLAELRRSILQIDAHRSFYLTRQRTREPKPAVPRTEARYGRLMTSNMGASSKPLWREHQQPRRSPGVGSATGARSGSIGRAQPSDLKQYLWDRFVTLLINHPFKVIYTLALLLVLGLVLSLIYGYHVTQNYRWP